MGKETGYEGVDWVHLAQDMNQLRALEDGSEPSG
jgi:hypothetical protein